MPKWFVGVLVIVFTGFWIGYTRHTPPVESVPTEDRSEEIAALKTKIRELESRLRPTAPVAVAVPSPQNTEKPKAPEPVAAAPEVSPPREIISKKAWRTAEKAVNQEGNCYQQTVPGQMRYVGTAHLDKM